MLQHGSLPLEGDVTGKAWDATLNPPAPGKVEVRLGGRVPSAINPPSGCHFHTRCPFKIGEICEQEEPPERNMGGGHLIYCHLPDEKLYEIKP